MVDHPILGDACPILAEITEIASYEEVAGSTIGEKMGKMLATADVLGYVDLRQENKPFLELLVPPCSGCRVYIPLKKFLEDILNRNAKGEVPKIPFQFGLYQAASAEEQQNNGRATCLLDAQTFISKHTIITAVAEAGKTYTAKLLMKEIAAKTQTQIVVFDVFNEYADTVKPVELTAKMDKEALAREIKKNPSTSLTTLGLTLQEKRGIYLGALESLLKLRLEEKIPSLLLFIEDADSLKGEALNQMVAEGRKIGIYICLITTCPSTLGGKILSQLGNQIIGKTTGKEDLEALAYMAGTANLSKLMFSEWIVNGISASGPMKVTVK